MLLMQSSAVILGAEGKVKQTVKSGMASLLRFIHLLYFWEGTLARGLYSMSRFFSAYRFCDSE